MHALKLVIIKTFFHLKSLTLIVDQEFSHTCLYEPLISQAVVEERKAGALKEWTYFEAMKAALSKQGKSKSSKSPVAASTR